MAKLQLVKNNVVVNTIEIEADLAVIDAAAGPGDIYDPETGIFTKPQE